MSVLALPPRVEAELNAKKQRLAGEYLKSLHNAVVIPQATEDGKVVAGVHGGTTKRVATAAPILSGMIVNEGSEYDDQEKIKMSQRALAWADVLIATDERQFNERVAALQTADPASSNGADAATEP